MHTFTNAQALLVLALRLLARPLKSDDLAPLTGMRRQFCQSECLHLQAVGIVARTPDGWKLQVDLPPSPLLQITGALSPEHPSWALTVLQDGPAIDRCEEVLRSLTVRGLRDRGSFLVVEAIVRLLYESLSMAGREAERPLPPLDGRIVTMIFSLQSLVMIRASLFRSVLRLSTRALHYAQATGNERFHALIVLSRMYSHIFFGRNTESLIARFKSAIDRIKSFQDADFSRIVPLFDGFLAYFLADFRRNIESYAYCPEDVPWYLANLRGMLTTCTLFSATYLRQHHFALGTVEYARTFISANDRFSMAFLECNACFVHLRMGDMKQARLIIARFLRMPVCRQHTGIYSIFSRGYALWHFLQGRSGKAYLVLSGLTRRALARDMTITAFKDPLVLDMVYVLSGLGRPEIPGYEIAATVERLLAGANLHLRGAAMRVKAMRLRDAGADPDRVAALLQSALDILLPLEDPHEIVLTAHWLAVALAECGRRQEARQRSDRLRRLLKLDLTGKSYQETSIACLGADAILVELYSRQHLLADPPSSEDVVARCYRTLKTLLGTVFEGNRQVRLLLAGQETFQAKRAALFAVEPSEDGAVLHLEHAVNLSDREVKSARMRPTLAWLADFAVRQPPAPMQVRGRDLVMRLEDLHTDRIWLLYVGDSLFVSLRGRLPASDACCLAHMFGAEMRIARLANRIVASERSMRQEITSSLLSKETRNECVSISGGLRLVLESVRDLARTDAPILLTGETGVGKEVMARSIHAMSGRTGPFVAVHPASFAESLFESEFFGHEKGSFTGAEQRKIGLFELADRGTLFIDEVGDMPGAVQPKLLRTLQEHTFLPEAATAELSSPLRPATAPHRHLPPALQEQRFLDDLPYRISVVPLHLPSLRSRSQDVLPLVTDFVSHFCRRYGKPVPEVGEEEQRLLTSYGWPGNVRELRNVVERAVILWTPGQRLRFNIQPPPQQAADDGRSRGIESLTGDMPTLDMLEDRYLRQVMERCAGRVQGSRGAAALLRIKPTTLYAKLRRHGIVTKSYQ